MNVMMAAMIFVRTVLVRNIDGADDPGNPEFWWVMSMALFAGFICAYPMNWWLVTNHLKHGMMTVRHPETEDATTPKPMPTMSSARPSSNIIGAMALLSITLLVTSPLVSGLVIR